MAEYIEREAFREFWNKEFRHLYPNDTYLVALANFPAADVVPIGAYKQVLWERDIAMGQLKEHGIPFGGEADVVEVMHGEWVERIEKSYCWPDDDVEIYYECSACGCNDFGKSPYCPNCGAKMDGKDGAE